jgi:hypothetical protein
MPTLTLKRDQIDKLATFVQKHGLQQIFIAKDHGAYIGASVGPDDNCIFYFHGCDPQKDKDFYENALAKFGGDDFGEHLDATSVTTAAADPTVKSMRFTITATKMKVETFR